jgi:hypothetical protein
MRVTHGGYLTGKQEATQIKRLAPEGGGRDPEAGPAFYRAIDDQLARRLRNIQAVFSCTCIR